MKLDPSVKEEYDVMAAVSGPDMQEEALRSVKGVVTARIRYAIGVDVAWNGMVMVRASALPENWVDGFIKHEIARELMDEINPNDLHHYLYHAKNGLEGLFTIKRREGSEIKISEEEIVALINFVNALFYLSTYGPGDVEDELIALGEIERQNEQDKLKRGT